MNIRKLESGRLRILALLALSMLFVIAISWLAPQRTHAEDVNNGTIKLTQGETRQLRAAIADAPQINWASSNTNVCAAINSSGLIQAIGGGTCTVSASVAGKRFLWTVKVTPLKLNKTELVLLPRRQGFDLNLNYNSSVDAWGGGTWNVTDSNSSAYGINGHTYSIIVSRSGNEYTIKVKDLGEI